ncbi:hypothetical protein BHM03_00054910, partial [Ensete ventricosum]
LPYQRLHLVHGYTTRLNKAEGGRKKKREKNLESADSSPVALARSVARGRFLLPARGEETSPCVGRRNEATFDREEGNCILLPPGISKGFINVGENHNFKGMAWTYQQVQSCEDPLGFQRARYAFHVIIWQNI